EEGKQAWLDPSPALLPLPLGAEKGGGAGEDEVVEGAEALELLAAPRHLARRRELAGEEGKAEVVEPRSEVAHRLADQRAKGFAALARLLHRVVHGARVALEGAVDQLEDQRVLRREVIVEAGLRHSGF